ncbi:hypothetical protein [Streptomyces thioluteus]
MNGTSTMHPYPPLAEAHLTERRRRYGFEGHGPLAPARTLALA